MARATLDADEREALARALRSAKLEILPLAGVLPQLAGLEAGETLAVTASPAKGLEASLEMAERLRRDGFAVVVHLAARMVADQEHLDQLLERMEAAGLDRAFVIGDEELFVRASIGIANHQGEELDTETGSTWEAIIIDPNVNDRPDGKSFRGVRQQFVKLGGSRGDQVALCTRRITVARIPEPSPRDVEVHVAPGCPQSSQTRSHVSPPRLSS